MCHQVNQYSPLTSTQMAPSLLLEAKVSLLKLDLFFKSSLLTIFPSGDDSGRVVIWNMAPVVKEKAELDDTVPKLLCQMDNHLGNLK